MTYPEARNWLITAASKAHQFIVTDGVDRQTGQPTQTVSACCCYVIKDGATTRNMDLTKGCNCGATQHNLTLRDAMRIVTLTFTHNKPAKVEETAPETPEEAVPEKKAKVKIQARFKKEVLAHDPADDVPI